MNADLPEGYENYDPSDPNTWPPLPTYPMYIFEDVAEALQEVRRQHHAGKPTIWTGPDEIHYSIAATVPPPSDHFTPEGREYSRDHGRNFYDDLIQVAFMFGWHNGVVTHEQRAAFLKESDQRQIDSALSALEKGDTERVKNLLESLRRVR